jgi:hypothetical protein
MGFGLLVTGGVNNASPEQISGCLPEWTIITPQSIMYPERRVEVSTGDEVGSRECNLKSLKTVQQLRLRRGRGADLADALRGDGGAGVGLRQPVDLSGKRELHV